MTDTVFRPVSRVCEWALVYQRASSVLAILVGGAVLAGWALDIAALKTVVQGLPAMMPNTAIAFAFAGLSLWLMSAENGVSHHFPPSAAPETVTDTVFWVGGYGMGLALCVGAYRCTPSFGSPVACRRGNE